MSAKLTDEVELSPSGVRLSLGLQQTLLPPHQAHSIRQLPLKGKPLREKMNHENNPNLTPYAQELRRNMTREERHLWYDFLKSYSVPFKRQKVIGSYIADFYCPAARLVIELDGSQHYESEGLASDAVRTAEMEELGIRVLRIPNNEIARNFPGVCEAITNAVAERRE